VGVILVTGASGNVGRHVVSGLLERGREVRALVRDAAAAGLPEGVDAVSGDLTDPPSLSGHLEGVEAVFLVWPFFNADGVEEVLEVLAAGQRPVVYLSAEAASRRPDAFWAVIERALERAGERWTFLRPTGFATNTLMWSEQIRQSGTVRWPYGRAARSLIHERDIADVAVSCLTEDGHVGARYVLSGPATLTQTEQAETIGNAIGRQVRWVELSREDAERRIDGLPGTALDTWASFVRTPEVVTPTVAEVTGAPARSFAAWAHDHVTDFR
jgi:uncharacterized protein YbjT (DUF2867 family)